MREPTRRAEQQKGIREPTALEEIGIFFHCNYGNFNNSDLGLRRAKEMIAGMMVVNPRAAKVEEAADEGGGADNPMVAEGERGSDLTVRGAEYWL